MAGGGAVASLRRNLASLSLVTAGALGAGSCSPEARRVRDGGPGADPGNKVLVEAPMANPHAADTTLWPGRAPTPVERLAAGTMPPPTPPQSTTAAPQAK